MNNYELKKKIVEVLKPVIRAGNISCNEENACKRCWFPCEIERTAGRLADALIAAGIGDVKEVEKEYRNAMLLAVKSQTLASERSRYMELNKNIAEHRAEVAEKALREACSRAWSIECTCPSIFEDNDECSECYKNQSEKRYEEKDAIGCLSKKLLEQAEKELAEERKDENN